MDSKLLAAIKPAIVYCLIDPRFPGNASRRYVGKTEGQLKRRLRNHIFRARRGQKTHVSCWLRSLLKAGLEPLVTILELTVSIAACDKERGWIAYLRSIGCPLTNLTDGGDGAPGNKNALGHHVSEEARARMSAAHKGTKNFLGHHHSEETIAKLMGNKNCLGKKNSLGYHHSEESIAKMMGNKNALGHHLCEEGRAKVSAAQKARYANHRESKQPASLALLPSGEATQ